MNNITFETEDGEKFTQYFIAVLAIVLAVLNVLFHLLLLVVIKSSKLLYTCTNAFVISIAASETIHGTFQMIVVVYPKLSNRWLQDGPLCFTILFFLYLGKTSAYFSLMMLSIDRCTAIYKPVKYSSLITPFSTGLLIALLWISSVVVSSILFWGRFIDEDGFRESTNPLGKIMNFIKDRLFAIAILSTCIPVVVMLGAVSIIIKEARARHRIFALATLPFIFPNIKPKAPLNTMRAMRSLFLIVTSYLLFGVSVTTLEIVKMYQPSDYPKAVSDFCGIWTITGCVLTPIIIGSCNRSYSRRLRHILSKCFRRKNTVKPSDFSVSTGLHSILEASYVISNFRPIPNNIILLANQSSRVHLRNSTNANPTAQSKTIFENPMLRRALSSPGLQSYH